MTERLFAYNELGEEEPIVMTETEILDEYWKSWSRMMLKRGGRSPRITPANCIEDFIIVNWAWEVGS